MKTAEYMRWSEKAWGLTEFDTDAMGGVCVAHGTTPRSQDVNADVIELTARRVAEILRPDLDAIACHLAEIRRSGSLAETLVQAFLREISTPEGLPAPVPDLSTPRPPEIDEACAAATMKGSAQRVHLFKYGMTLNVAADADPQEVWAGILEAVNAGGGEREIGHPLRASGH